MKFSTLLKKDNRFDLAALLLRLGLGAVFVIGGGNKLYQLLDPALSDGILVSYYGTSGYVNGFFADFLFGNGFLGQVFTEWGFLTALSTFELASGLLLLAGVVVRPVALIYGLLLWTFVMALPVITVAGIGPEIVTYRSPALLVQIRDVALSGMMFTLFNIGAGKFAFERQIFGGAKIRETLNWEVLGLLLRVSLALPLLVGGVFIGYDHIQSFASPAWVLVPLGFLILFSVMPKVTGTALAVLMLYFIVAKVGFDKSLIANLNGFKRELAFLAGALVYARLGGGHKFIFKNPNRSSSS